MGQLKKQMQNLLDPAILFFLLGVLAGVIKSNLEIPPAISRFLSLYLLMALGLKGGFALSQSGLTANVGISLAAAIVLAIFIPLMGYWFLRRFVTGFDAAAVAATYGSVSAVTFVTAVQYLENPTYRLRWSHGRSHGSNGITGHHFGRSLGQFFAAKNKASDCEP
jgi:uncharacterized protein